MAGPVGGGGHGCGVGRVLVGVKPPSPIGGGQVLIGRHGGKGWDGWDGGPVVGPGALALGVPGAGLDLPGDRPSVERQAGWVKGAAVLRAQPLPGNERRG